VYQSRRRPVLIFCATEFEGSLQCGVQGLGSNIHPKEDFAFHIEHITTEI
jgi:hypothetical protein